MQTSSTEWIEALTERSDWVRALARSLVSDEHLAEDLMQDAAVAALQVKAQPEHVGWLVGTMRNLAANMSRRSVRRRRREELVVRRSAEPGAAESAAFVEQQRILAEAVLALDGPFRDVVLLRFYDGLPQREIAKRLAVPKATVNSRLTRALQKLRMKLDARHGGDRKAWVAALSPIGFAVNASAAVPLGLKLVGALAAVVVVAAASIYLVDPFSSDGQSAVLPLSEKVIAAVVDESKAVEEESLDSSVRREPISPASSTSVQGIRVRVVDATTGEAAPEADVRRMDKGAGSDPSFAAVRREIGLGRARMDEFYAMLPRQDLAEDATFILQQESDLVFALTPDRIGLLPPRGRRVDSEGVVLLELWPLHEVKVRVVDARGQVQRGVPVGIMPGDLRIDTDELQGQASLSWSYGYSGSSGRIDPEVFLAFPLAEPVRERVIDSPGQTEEIELTMPAVGSVRVFVTAGGAPVADGTLVYLSNAAERMGLRNSFFAAETHDSTAEFWPVGLGIELRAALQPSWQSRFFEVKGQGPTFEGESVELRLETSARVIEVTGRLLDEEGEPLVDMEWNVALLADGEVGPPVPVRTDGSGGFQWTFTVDSESRDLRIKLANSSTGLVRELPMPALGAVSIVDLGDIEISAEIPVISGVVVDVKGRAIEGARVSFARATSSSSTGWRSTGTRTGESDAEGRFAIWGEAPKGEVWVRASLAGPWYHDAVQWQRDGREFRLQLQPAGVLAGRILADPLVPLERLGVHVWLESAPGSTMMESPLFPSTAESAGLTTLGKARVWVEGTVDRVGRFSMSSLRPDTYTFAIYQAGVGELLRILAVQVHPGENQDPRFTAIDLRGKIRVITLDVRDEKGVQVKASATAYVNEAKKMKDVYSLGDARRPLLIPQADVLKSIVVRAEGYFPVRLGPVEGRQEVVLSRGIPAPVNILGVSKLEKPFALRLYLLDAKPIEQGKRRRMPSAPQQAIFDEQGHADLRVPRPGDYRARLVLLWEENGSELHQDVNTESFPTLTVPDAGWEQPFALTLPSGAIETSMQALREKVQRFQESR